MRKESMQEIAQCLRKHLETHPQATEEDVVKFVFQAMLGVGHLVSSAEAIQNRLEKEMAQNPPDDTEPLTEELSPGWLRLNLRPAKAWGITPEDLAQQVHRSAQTPVQYTRQDVIDFCLTLEPNGMDREKIKAAAEQLLNESFLPSHSQQYRGTYKPAYVVITKEEMI